MGNTSSRIHSAATADPSHHFSRDFLESAEPRFSGESFLFQLNLNQQFGGHRNEFLALSHENDPELFFESLFNLARRLENEDHLETATRIYAAIISPRALTPTPLPQGEGELGQTSVSESPSPPGRGIKGEGPDVALTPPSNIQHQAAARLAAILGEGSNLERIEFLSRRLARQAMDPAALFAMTAAGAVFKVVQFGSMSRLAATPLGQSFASRILAGMVGFAAEVPTFTAASRVGNAVLGREQIWTREEIRRELASGAIVLGCLRTVGGIFGLAGNRWGLPQTGTFTGIFVGHKLEEWVGLRAPHDNATTLIDSASTFIQFHIAGRLNHEILPERYHRWERALEQQTSAPTPHPGPLPQGEGGRRPGEGLVAIPQSPMSDIRWTIRNLLLAPAFMFLSVEGIGGGGPGRRRQIDVPIHQRPTLILAQGEKGSLPPPPSPGAEPLGWFENVYQAEEIFPIENPSGTPEITVGRSTGRQRNVFPPDFRQISRHHLDMRERGGNIEVRAHEGSYGVRINHTNLAPFEWYRLHERDVVEFVSEARRDIEAVNADATGQISTETRRLSEDAAMPLPNVDEVDRPAVFLFRRRLPGQPRIFERAWSSIKKTLRPSQFPTIPLTLPSSDRPPPPLETATKDPEEIFRELRRLSEDLGGSISLLEAGINREDIQRNRREVLQALLLIHQSFCGTSQRTVPVEEKDNPLTPPTLRMIRVPNWEGRILTRLHYFEMALESFSRERKATPHLGAAREEIAHLRDRFSRLLELVRLFRRHYTRREEQALFAAIEDAYQGLRPEGTVGAEQVRSTTRSLDVTVRREQRQRWAEQFVTQNPAPPSLAIFNMRVILGEISKVKGQEVAGSFYQTLAGGTLYEGMRAVRAYYDVKSGELVAFSDGSRRVYRAIAELQVRGRRLQEVSIFVDALQSGRIIDIAGISPETRESLGNALLWLRGLQVLPENNP